MNTVHIGYVDVAIIEADLNEEGLFGSFEFHPQPEIHIDSSLPPRYKAATALHEVLEAISAIYGLDLSEAQIRTLEATLAGIALRQPDVVLGWLKLLGEG